MAEIEPPHEETELQAVAKSGDIFRALIGYSQDAVLGLNHKGVIVFWNKGAQQIFGYSSQEILGQPLARLISPKHRQTHTQVLDAFLGGNCGKIGTIEAEGVRKDGSTFPVEFSLSIEQQSGKFAALAVARDITDHKRTEQALRKSAERYCDLFATCLGALLSADMPDKASAGSSALEGLRRYCLQQLTEMRPMKIPTPEAREYVSRQVDDILSRGEPASKIVREVFDKDGKMVLTQQYLDFVKRESETKGPKYLHREAMELDRTALLLKSFLADLVGIVSHVIEFSDPYTAQHQQRVADLARLVGRSMSLPDEVIEKLYFYGLLHDIGKISIPKSILTKPGELSGEEWALIRAHTRQGYNILKDANLPWPIAEVALRHHERLDGSGYPNGVRGSKLSLEISILAVCDVVEAMSSHRPYRPARAIADVVGELAAGRGTKYDASVVDAMLPMIESGALKSLWD